MPGRLTADAQSLGDEWIYRLRVHSPSKHVKMLGIEKRKQTNRVDIAFLDDGEAGPRDNVPGTRLHGPWSGISDYDERSAGYPRRIP